jgi:hypothetical protein
VPGYEGRGNRNEEKKKHRLHRDAAEESPGLHQTEKQEHEGACEKRPPTASEPAHAPILSWSRLPKKRDDLLDLRDVIADAWLAGASSKVQLAALVSSSS